MLTLRIVIIPFLTVLAKEANGAALKRQTSELSDSYDFIIAGGGTAGLTVADRLSEAFPEKTVLVVEYGEVEYARGGFDPPDIIFGGVSTAPRPGLFYFQSLPNLQIKNKTAQPLVGKTVGGSSSVNGMFFDRPSRHDFEALAEASGSEGGIKWDWEGVFGCFKKSVTFTPPSASSVHKYNYTWDMSAYGGTTPIYSSLPPFLWGDNLVVRSAWREMGIRELDECAGGNKEGLCWIPISQHPVTARRSHSGLGHYADVIPRDNYHIMVKHQVVRVVYSNGIPSGPPIVEIRSLANDTFSNLTAKAEVIISAGTFHTPTILHRSGIGASHILKATGVQPLIDLPGVGANLQDHHGPAVSWNYTKPTNFDSMPTDMIDPTFAADAAAGFDETPARGPYTLSMSNSAIFVSLPNITAEYMSIIDSIRSTNSTQYLPADYAGDPTLIEGYKHQLDVLAEFLADSGAPSTESTFTTGTSVRAVLLHPLSRGTVRLNATNHLAQPIIDYRLGSNPIDFDVHVAHVKYLRRMIDTPTMKLYGAMETGPGMQIQNDDALREYVKDSMVLSFMHPCCTAAMMPRELGGVVGTDLKVHGATGLRVVDISVLPFLVSSHTSSVAYAIGEKAADIIIGQWRS